MFESFNWRHVPCLLVATPMFFGGLIHSLLRPKEALLTWGAKPQTANSRDAHIVYYGHALRTSTFGLLIYVLYLQNNLAAIDALMAVIGGFCGIADMLVVWNCGNRNVIPPRLASVLVMAAWGAAGMTSGGGR